MFNKLKRYINRWADRHIVNKLIYDNRVQALRNSVLHCKERGVTANLYGKDELIVSLTTYSKRLYEACLAIETIMQQTLKPNKIVLWLGYDLQDTDLPLTSKSTETRFGNKIL
jgi:hypothetical protein